LWPESAAATITTITTTATTTAIREAKALSLLSAAFSRPKAVFPLFFFSVVCCCLFTV